MKIQENIIQRLDSIAAHTYHEKQEILGPEDI